MRTVCSVDPSLRYSDAPPYDAAETFPEIAAYVTERIGDNVLQGTLRKLFVEAGLDKEHFGSSAWNPLGGWIKPGQRVVLKPNWVFEPRQGERQLITEGSFIRAVLDYVIVALRGAGKITICDAPVQSADFDAILQAVGVARVFSGLARDGLELVVADLRREMALTDTTRCRITGYRKLAGDPLGYAEVDLGASSFLDELCQVPGGVTFHSSHYDERLTGQSHQAGIHRYLIARSVLDADVVVNLPKVKTHKKSGVTGALKNLVGINGGKEHVVHFTRGPGGGDEFAKRSVVSEVAHFVDVHTKDRMPGWLWKVMYAGWRTYKNRILRRSNGGAVAEETLLSYGGSWHGNRTIWRTIYDLNLLLFYADRDGKLSPGRKREVLAIADGIVAGEGEGPLACQPRSEGIVIMGDDPVAVDACFARVMGFPEERIPILAEVRKQRAPYIFSRYGGESPLFAGGASEIRPFLAPATWRGHLR